jgi:hypothetical protein
MTFIKFLQVIGDRFGILESVSNPECMPATRIQTRIVSLRELAGEIRSREIRALADSPAEIAAPFEKIFEAAGISSKPEDWTIERLKQVIASETGNQKTREAVQKFVLELLNLKGVPGETIIKDAIARDQALDSFESRAGEKMQARKDACSIRLQEIELQMKDLREESARIEESLRADEEKWRQWRKLKRIHERELASVASYIVDHPVITMDDEE